MHIEYAGSLASSAALLQGARTSRAPQHPAWMQTGLVEPMCQKCALLVSSKCSRFEAEMYLLGYWGKWRQTPVQEMFHLVVAEPHGCLSWSWGHEG